MLTSTASLAALALAGDRSSLVEMVTWLDQETLLLLFSMMLLVSILAETRIFDFLAVFAFEVFNTSKISTIKRINIDLKFHF